MSKVLIVEDEEAIAEIEKDYLELSGFDVTIRSDGESGLATALADDYDIMILDVMLPGVDGYEICKQVRESKNTPIIMVSAKKEDIDKIRGLGVGADDYMTKPFGVMELAARIRSLLRRRARNQADEEILEKYGISLNKKTREVTSRGKKVELTLKEYELLLYLMENHSRVATRDELLNHIWGYDYDGETRTLDMHIRTLRQKLGEEGAFCIRTVRGVGYRFVKTEEG